MICLSPLGIIFAGVLADSIGFRKTVLLGAGLSAASCLVVLVPGVRNPNRPDYQPVPLPDELTHGKPGPALRGPGECRQLDVVAAPVVRHAPGNDEIDRHA